MSAPGDDKGRRRFLDRPRWMDSWPPGIAAPILLFAPVGAFIGLVLYGVLFIGGWATAGSARFSGMVAFVSISVIGVVVCRYAELRARATDRPRGVVPQHLFAVTFLARGGWLSQFLDPAAVGDVVVEDEGIVLRCRRIRNHLLLFAFAFMALPVPEEFRAAGWCAGLVLWVVTAVLVRSERIPWASILAARAAGRRFHLEVSGDSHREGILIEAGAGDRDRLVEALRARTTLVEEGDAPAPGSS